MKNLKQYQLNNNILCVDLKSFYATIECVLRGLDPFETPLVVADVERGGGSIVLAVSPFLRAKGIPGRLRIYELPKDIEIIYAKPQMKKYLEYSTKVIETYLEFISIDDIFVYSIDEVFLDVTAYLKYYNLTDYELAEKILKRIHEKLGLTATCGIGPNMIMAKLAMDIGAKKAPNGIVKWNYEDLENTLWKVKPLSKMWSIGNRMEEHLTKMGYVTIGDIANGPREKLTRRFGVLGTELWYHSNGIDMSLVQDKDKLRREPKSIGSSQVLFRDYNASEILVIILEMVDDVTRRLRASKKRAKTVSLMIGYTKAYGGGFSRQVTMDQSTANDSIIYSTCLDLFDSFYEGYPIRTVGVSLSNLDESKIYQLSLFEDVDALDREIRIQETVDKLKIKYGNNSVLKGSSLQKHATAKERNKQIGGHSV